MEGDVEADADVDVDVGVRANGVGEGGCRVGMRDRWRTQHPSNRPLSRGQATHSRASSSAQSPPARTQDATAALATAALATAALATAALAVVSVLTKLCPEGAERCGALLQQRVIDPHRASRAESVRDEPAGRQ